MKNNGANNTTNGTESSVSPTLTNDSDSTSTENPPLHDRLTDHLANCSECQATIKSKTPLGIGTISKHCSEYQRIISEWAEHEGAVNNIVAHDEYGNQASGKDYWERRPDGW
jgi:hypothetical protein